MVSDEELELNVAGLPSTSTYCITKLLLMPWLRLTFPNCAAAQETLLGGPAVDPVDSVLVQVTMLLPRMTMSPASLVA